MVDTRFNAPGREDSMGCAPGRVTIVAGCSHIYAALGGLAVDRGLVYFDRVIDQYVVLGSDVQVLVTLTAGVREIDRVNCRPFYSRWQDIVVTMAITAMGHVNTSAQLSTAVGLVLFRLLFVTSTAPLATGFVLIVDLMRIGVSILVAIQALEAFMHRVIEIVPVVGTVEANVVAVGAG
jgi:hypothetical protein